jgi:hypothetical protein
MKNLILGCIALLSVLGATAQKCKKYNPYQHTREEYIQTERKCLNPIDIQIVRKTKNG